MPVSSGGNCTAQLEAATKKTHPMPFNSIGFSNSCIATCIATTFLTRIIERAGGGRFEVDERSGVVRTRENSPFQLDLEYVLYVKAEDQNGRLDGRRYQSTPEERLSIVGGKRQPQFYMPVYEAEIPENQKKDSE